MFDLDEVTLPTSTDEAPVQKNLSMIDCRFHGLVSLLNLIKAQHNLREFILIYNEDMDEESEDTFEANQIFNLVMEMDSAKLS